MKKILTLYFRFILIGGLVTFIDFFIYICFSVFLNIVISKIMSFIIACIISFFFNKKWTFQIKNEKKKYYFKYFLVQVINLLINVNINSYIYININNKIISFIIATGIATIVNFCLQKYYVFK